MHVVGDKFEPADFSLPELRFLREHLKEPTTVALHGKLPPGVAPEAIRAALTRFAELEDLHKHRNVPWAGYEPIEDSIDRFIAYQEKCMEAQQYGEPRHPSQKTWDSTGAMSDGGIGSDSADKVRNELREDGTRIPFAVKLVDGKRRSKVWGRPRVINTQDDKITHANGVLHCTICDKPITSYDPARASSRTVNKARSTARKHCMTSKHEEARHRAIANVPVE